MRHVTQTRTALAEQAAIACPNPYELLRSVRVLRKDLNLTSNDITVLTALISFLPRDQSPNSGEAQRKLTVVFPSNASFQSAQTASMKERFAAAWGALRLRDSSSERVQRTGNASLSATEGSSGMRLGSTWVR